MITTSRGPWTAYRPCFCSFRRALHLKNTEALYIRLPGADFKRSGSKFEASDTLMLSAAENSGLPEK